MMPSQVVGLRHVAGEEAHTRIVQGEQEGRVAGQPVELGNDQRRAGETGKVQRRLELRAVVPATTFHLGEPGKHCR
jgi:hypothetical protein